MVNIIKAEHQKAKRTMRKKFILGFPLLTFVMAFIFTLGMTNAYAESVWNWWYTLLLPGMIALFCYLSVAQEKKIKYYHLMTIPTDRRKLLLGKIIYIGYMILFSNVIVFAGATLGGFLLTTHVPVGGALIAVLFLTVSELWEIPVALFLSERFGMIVNLLRLPIYYRQRCGNITNQNLVCTCFCNPYANDVPVASCFTKWTCRRSRESSFGYGSHCSGNVSLNHLVCFCNGSVFEMV